jgi:hypothetical protein
LYRQFGRQTKKFVGEGQLALFDAGEAADQRVPNRGTRRKRLRAITGPNGGGNRLTSASRGSMNS